MKEETNSGQNIGDLACPAEFSTDATISIEILGEIFKNSAKTS